MQMGVDGAPISLNEPFGGSAGPFGGHNEHTGGLSGALWTPMVGRVEPGRSRAQPGDLKQPEGSRRGTMVNGHWREAGKCKR